MLKNKICYILLIMLFAVPVLAEDSLEPAQADENSVVVEQPINVLDDEVNARDDSEEQDVVQNKTDNQKTEFKTPMSKKHIAKQFIFAMLGVIISSLLIYFGLTIYNRIRYGISYSEGFAEKNRGMLETPSTYSEAVKTFVNKTEWK